MDSDCDFYDDYDDYDENDEAYDQTDEDEDEGYLDDSQAIKRDQHDGDEPDEEPFPHECLAPDEVVSLMSESIQEVKEIVKVSRCLEYLIDVA